MHNDGAERGVLLRFQTSLVESLRNKLTDLWSRTEPVPVDKRPHETHAAEIQDSPSYGDGS